MAVVISASKLAELLSSIDENDNMYVRVLTESRLAVGADPDRPTLMVDLSKEKIGPYHRPQGDPLDAPLTNGPQAPLGNGTVLRSRRRSGDYSLEIRGRRQNCGSLKELLAVSLTALEEAIPGTLDKLSRVKGRSRHIVAREPSLLFSKRHLSEKYAEQLAPGWWYGTNNSAEQTQVWLKRACKLSGLKWGEDFQINLYEGLAIKIEL